MFGKIKWKGPSRISLFITLCVSRDLTSIAHYISLQYPFLITWLSWFSSSFFATHVKLLSFYFLSSSRSSFWGVVYKWCPTFKRRVQGGVGTLVVSKYRRIWAIKSITFILWGRGFDSHKVWSTWHEFLQCSRHYTPLGAFIRKI